MFFPLATSARTTPVSYKAASFGDFGFTI